MAELKKVLAVVGPTAAGKTALAVELCKAFNGEVVSCEEVPMRNGPFPAFYRLPAVIRILVHTSICISKFLL